MTQGSNVVYCNFARTADPLCHWCNFLVLGPGQWQQQLTVFHHCHGKWIVLGGLGGSVGIVSSVFSWTQLAADNGDDDNDDNDTYDTKM
eukprot:1821738-Ditylum_brightwellii.AAC.1